MNEKKYLSVEQVSERLGVPSRTVRDWIAKGTFKNAVRNNPSAGRTTPYKIPEIDVVEFEVSRVLSKVFIHKERMV